ncbi:MAG: DUF3305 domain-containing protein [Granulosicoccaceae bacterium]
MNEQHLFQAISNGTRLSLPVSVVLRQRTIQRGRWSVPVWELEAVAMGSQAKLCDGSGELVRQTDSEKSYSWSGWSITFYKDACERYWHALIGDKPLVYVVCRDPLDDDATLSTEPLLVTCDYDEATAYLETDDTVLSMPIPADIYRHMEAFVMQHYQPKPFKKRMRKKWLDGEARGGRQ